jgi:uncharacterized membrane protein
MMTTAETKFPADRILYFSDAIFAIAITLLVLEIKIPTSVEVEALGTLHVLRNLTARFVGYLVSFVVAALFWRAHMLLGQRITSFDNKLLWINTWLLLFVVLMPFSTAFYSNNFVVNGTFNFYCLNLAAIGAILYWMNSYVAKKENLVKALGRRTVNWMKQRALIVPIIFLACMPLGIISPLLGRLGFVLIFIFQAIGDRYLKTGSPK